MIAPFMYKGVMFQDTYYGNKLLIENDDGYIRNVNINKKINI